MNKVRVKYGPIVSVLDLSRGGVQIETEAHRLQPGSTVVLELSGEGPAVTIPAQVLRCQVAGISPQTIYRGGLAFKRAIDFPAEVVGNDGQEPNPFREHAKLSLAWKRRSASAASDVFTGHSELITSVGGDALAAALAMIDTAAARAAGAPFARELSRLFTTVTEGLEEEATSAALVRLIADQLRRAVPARSIRLLEGGRASDLTSTAAMCFEVPSDDDRTARLIVDIWPGGGIQEWHFQYLKAAAHLLGLVRRLEDRNLESPAAVENDLPSGWHRVVVRYTDGRLLKGYSREFTVSSTAMQVWPTPGAPPNTRITVPLGYLKAILFVRDFEGNPEYVEGSLSTPRHGRLIAVTFLDGETLVGTTLNYNPDALGFFVRPVDGESNNARVFVGARAIRHVQFPSAARVADRFRSSGAEAFAGAQAV